MKVVINYQEYDDVEIEKAVLREGLPDCDIVESRTLDPSEFIKDVCDADAVIVQYVPCTGEVIASMRRVRVLVRYGISVDNIDMRAARAQGIRVCNVPFYCLEEVSNHALAMILALHRKLCVGNRMLREDRHRLESLRPIPRLSEATAGLLGFGHIGRALAKKLRPLVSAVLVSDPLVGEEEALRADTRKVAIEELFRASDIISVHVPITEGTRHLVNAALLSRMKSNAVLVNTSRGAVVNEADLVAALKKGAIAGAGLDVFEREPLPASSPLRSLDNVILTSHYAWYSEGAMRELKVTAAEEILRVLQGREPRFEVIVP